MITCRTHSFEEWLKYLMSIGGPAEPRSHVPEWGNWYDAGCTPEEAIAEDEAFLKITRDGRIAPARSEAAS